MYKRRIAATRPRSRACKGSGQSHIIVIWMNVQILEVEVEANPRPFPGRILYDSARETIEPSLQTVVVAHVLLVETEDTGQRLDVTDG